MSEPTEIWLDARVAKTLPTRKDDELAERGVDQVHYIHEAKVKEMLRQVGPPEEMIVQVTGSPGILYGLSNLGNVYALGNDGWEQVAAELKL